MKLTAEMMRHCAEGNRKREKATPSLRLREYYKGRADVYELLAEHLEEKEVNRVAKVSIP